MSEIDGFCVHCLSFARQFCLRARYHVSSHHTCQLGDGYYSVRCYSLPAAVASRREGIGFPIRMSPRWTCYRCSDVLPLACEGSWAVDAQAIYFVTHRWHAKGPGTVRYGSIRYGTIRYGTVRYDTVRYGTVRYGTVRYDTVH